MKFLLAGALALAACGGDDSADGLGVGAQCAVTEQCNQDIATVCLDEFKGGYCGLAGCAHDSDCPEDSACILFDTGGTTYCFRTCGDKAECNANREPANESNCSSSVMFVDGAMGRKACLPPSG
ncbi:MAG: hypothetical protein JWP01_3751 [Myxococcales bacterium]|nr:hypothetical protein [Myxococcales bacterium]